MKVLKKQLPGYVKLIRFADDFVLCFQTEDDAREGYRKLEKRLAKFGLNLSREKTQLIRFGRADDDEETGTFDFLGFTHYCGRTKKGNFKVGRKTSVKKFTAKLSELRDWIRKVSNRASPREWWPKLCTKLVGHIRYYGVSGNYNSVARFRYLAGKAVFKWLNRRSQRRSYNWEEFLRYLEKHPLPEVKIYHNLYTLSVDG